MKLKFVIITFVLVVYQSIPKSETRRICRQRVHNTMEFLKCPQSSDDVNKELKYCCLNNGMMSCCNHNDYLARHEGPSAMTMCLVVISEIVVIIMTIWWCYRCIHS